MERFHSIAGSVLIGPSATQAEHVRHQLARAGFALRPSRITTLAGFLESRAPAAPSNFLLHLAIKEALARLRPVRFAPIAEDFGFLEALTRLAQEAPAEAVDGDLAGIFREVERALTARGFALPRRRLLEAAKDPGALPPHLVFDGFFSFSPAERNFLAALAARTAVTVTLPDWPGADETRRGLLSRGFREQNFQHVYRSPAVEAFAAPTLEREVEEIARRVLEEAQRGQHFRAIGVILRVREPYAAALETTFARFGIPARFYFPDALSAHPLIAFFTAIVRALLSGWDYEKLLAVAQMPASGLDSRFDFALREHIPGRGLPLAWLDETPPFLERLAAIDSWRLDRAEPRSWSSRLKTLHSFAIEPAIGEKISRDELRAWQSAAAAAETFDAALEEAAAVLNETGSGAMPLGDFWRNVETALRVTTLRVPDRRVNVVHIFDVYEARQWELPVVFVCGMTEGHFPQFHREDAILNDVARHRARLRTSTDRQNEERRLFELAATRAIEKTILSFARFNEKGDDALPSSFLTSPVLTGAAPSIGPLISTLARAAAVRPGLNVESLSNLEEPDDAVAAGRGSAPQTRVHPRPLRSVSPPVPAPVQEPGLLARLARTHNALAPTSIETFLQCPFQFFAGKTLKLRGRPPQPRERLDVRVQGNILHRVLAEWARAPLYGSAVFDDIFEEECRRARIPFNYRTEAIRLEMRRNFEAFLADREISLSAVNRLEEQFHFALNPLLALRGRIDRLDLLPQNQALVIDYKYSAANKIRERTGDDEAGNLVQGGLYMLAAERVFGLKPAGMLYCGLRKGVSWEGWHVPVAGLERTGSVVSRGILDEMTRAAAAKAMEVFEAIASGEIAARPADEKKCAWCDYADICRVESQAGKAAANA